MGQSLASAAAVRAQISQIEKYNTAANTFREKYGFLPGDIPDPAASGFGFQARGQYAGEGDGNGIIEGVYSDAAASNSGYVDNACETVMFWADLSKAGLIEGSFPTASSHTQQYATTTSVPSLNAFLPAAKIGGGNFIYIWSRNGTNYYGLSNVSTITCCGATAFLSVPGITVAQASSIDSKIDDGFPQTGGVVVEYINAGAQWSPPGGTDHGTPQVYRGFAGSGTTCDDNANVWGNVPMLYSLTQNGGAGVNCALSFKMQAGD